MKIFVMAGTEDGRKLAEILKSGKFTALVDSSHPYAQEASQNALKACTMTNISYIRFERDSAKFDALKLIHVENYEQAALKAAELGKNIFLTTGSKTLKIFVELLKGCNITARVLPTAEVLAQCETLGLTPKQIIAVQGPFSTEMNVEMFRHAAAEVIVTKDSGQIGGTDTKIAAAQILNLPVIMIDRPKIFYPNVAATFEEVLNLLKNQSSIM